MPALTVDPTPIARISWEAFCNELRVSKLKSVKPRLMLAFTFFFRCRMRSAA